MSPSKTLHIHVTDAEIRRHASTDIHVLRDPRFPALHFRYWSSDRNKGSWYVVVNDRWSKAANYPGIDAKTMQTLLPTILVRRLINIQASSTVSGWHTVGELLSWYSGRMTRDRGLSSSRKASAKSALHRQLLPRLHAVLLVNLNHARLDELLLWPMQEQYALSYVRSVYAILAVAFRQAFTLKLIDLNPMAGFKFGDFVQTRIKPKPARLRRDDLDALLTSLADASQTEPKGRMLALMMLCHGTRLGETRVARWKHINLINRHWFIPADDTKTKHAHTLPLSDQVCSLLLQYRAHQQTRGYVGAYLFPGVKGQPLSARSAGDVFVQLGRGAWTSHDLRKLARTAWMELGVDYLVGELLLNHTMKELDATYIHTTAEALKRKALESWHAWLDLHGFTALHGETEPRPVDVLSAEPAAVDGPSSRSVLPLQGRKFSQ
ncbi:site-specific integrase [Pseudomonas fluorescens]|uniref:Integrase n=1 Tax=Pseudomonas fluorescens TaxID=294 RepID=A0A0F4TNK4_PSEFL|nr:site-specific integrase [Pseudomonas fluorescens]KJZ46016.1 integrase [Pseudomonas fluorescens]